MNEINTEIVRKTMESLTRDFERWKVVEHSGQYSGAPVSYSLQSPEYKSPTDKRVMFDISGLWRPVMHIGKESYMLPILTSMNIFNSDIRALRKLAKQRVEHHKELKEQERTKNFFEAQNLKL